MNHQNTLKLVLASFATLLFSSCATVTAIQGPDGTTNQLVRCNRIEDCYSKAREVCAGDYKIVNSTNSSDANGTTHELLVKCGN